jgi:protoheme IX farnesyltransferase
MKTPPYLRLVNPPTILLLAFTGVMAGLMGGGLGKPWALLDVTIAIALCSMGTRALTNYIDRDIDARMTRTKDRPLPSGEIPPRNAVVLGLSLVVVGLASAYPLGRMYPLFLVLGIAGLLDNILLYNLWLKRRTVWSTILVAPSGGIPALVAYSTMAGGLSVAAISVAVLVMLWAPIHTWSLAIRYRSDYSDAGLPMLPTTMGLDTGIKCIGALSIILALFTIALPFLPGSPFGALTLVVSIVMGAALLALSSMLLWRPTEGNSWRLFKFTSPYLATLFVVMALNVGFGLNI